MRPRLDGGELAALALAIGVQGCGSGVSLPEAPLPPPAAPAGGSYTVLHSFVGSDGGYPTGKIVLDGGYLYGVTARSPAAGGPSGQGGVFELAVEPGGRYSVLHGFVGSDGANPFDGPALGMDGRLYGTTRDGGATGSGVVYRLAIEGAYGVLHSFRGGDGRGPIAGVVIDVDGTLYGTTWEGGPSNRGVVYKLDPSGAYRVLHVFRGTGDGSNPGGLVLDSEGVLYGSTFSGTVFRLAPDATFTVLHHFTGGEFSPRGLVRDRGGNLYGLASGGAFGSGCVFRISPDGAYAVLHSFEQGSTAPKGLILGPAGELYGTTYLGGTANSGVLYKLVPGGSYTVLHNFNRSTNDGGWPDGGLVLDTAGNLYGTTQLGGAMDWGVVFKLILPAR